MLIRGRVASLHVHPERSGEAMRPVEEIELVAQKGIVQAARYFGRKSALGRPAKRQVTLIEREEIGGHATALGIDLPPGAVRSNLETEGVELAPLLGKKVRIGSAVLLLGELRTPCQKMDQLGQGLRARMEEGRQGVIAQVVTSGFIRVGDAIELLEG